MCFHCCKLSRRIRVKFHTFHSPISCNVWHSSMFKVPSMIRDNSNFHAKYSFIWFKTACMVFDGVKCCRIMDMTVGYQDGNRVPRGYDWCLLFLSLSLHLPISILIILPIIKFTFLFITLQAESFGSYDYLTMCDSQIEAWGSVYKHGFTSMPV